MSIDARKLVLALTPLCLLCGAVDVAAVTLEESVEATLLTNPDVGVVEADREAIDQELRQARADYLPSIDLRGAAGPEYTDSPTTRNDGDNGDDSTLMRLESQITLSQMLHEWALHDIGHIRQIAELVRARKYLAGAGPLGEDYQLKP